MRRALRLGVAAVVAVAAASSAARAQTAAELATACTRGGGDGAACAAAAVAARSVAGALAIAAGPGVEVAGTASNLGQRLGTSPRVALAVRVATVRAGLPDLSAAPRSGERTFSVTAVHADAALGLFDGFRVMPTVGGVLALDAVGRASLVLLPADEGFSDDAHAFSLGVRVGLLRESFTLPGVSVSIARRFVGEVALGGASGGGLAEVGVDPAVTSVRAIVGKNVLGAELLAGVGWDDHGADVAYGVRGGLGAIARGSGPVEGTRRSWFVGGSMSFGVVLSLSLEAGLAEGFDPPASYAGAAYDPSGSSFFGSLGLRLTI